MNEDRLMMIWEKNRLDSFKKWPYTDKEPCNIRKMAEAGFFWVGTEEEPDSAQCFVCNKLLDGWEVKDDPWKEHRHHAPKCPFIRLGQPEDHLTVSQFHDLWTDMVKNIITNFYTDERKRLEYKVTNLQAEIRKNL